MNQRATIWALLFVVIILTLTKTPLLAALLTFLFIGIIPGTAIVIPSWVLLIVYPVAFVLVSRLLVGRTLFFGEQKKPEPVAPTKKVRSQKTSTTQQSTTPAKRRARVAT